VILCQYCGDIFPLTYFLDQLKLEPTLELEDKLDDDLLELHPGDTVYPIKPKETTIDDTKNKRKKLKNLAGLKIKVFFFILSSP